MEGGRAGAAGAAADHPEAPALLDDRVAVGGLEAQAAHPAEVRVDHGCALAEVDLRGGHQVLQREAHDLLVARVALRRVLPGVDTARGCDKSGTCCATPATILKVARRMAEPVRAPKEERPIRG
jgi:hypothetical protein